jgi:hypothetical protein
MTFKGFGIISHGIINGDPVWREKTAEEVLLEELRKNELNNMTEEEKQEIIDDKIRTDIYLDAISGRCPKCGEEVRSEDDGLCQNCV